MTPMKDLIGFAYRSGSVVIELDALREESTERCAVIAELPPHIDDPERAAEHVAPFVAALKARAPLAVAEMRRALLSGSKYDPQVVRARPRAKGYLDSSATLSKDGLYRYHLTRRWDKGFNDHVCWVLLHPGTGDGQADDPTVRRCVELSQQLGYGGMSLLNLYGYRAGSPKDLVTAARNGADIVGPDNVGTLRMAALVSSVVIVGWGSHPLAPVVGPEVVDMFREGSARILTLGCTASGDPRHPLYLPKRTLAKAVPYEIEGEP